MSIEHAPTVILLIITSYDRYSMAFLHDVSYKMGMNTNYTSESEFTRRPHVNQLLNQILCHGNKGIC